MGRFAHGLKGLAVLAAVTLLGGCQTIVPRSGPDPSVQTEAVVTAPVPVPVTTALPTDGGRHRIALLVPMSGTNSGIGQSLANASNMALLDARAQNIRITTYDTATGAKAAAEKAIADGNGLILGPLLSEDVIEAAGVALPRGVPIISFSNDIGAATGNVFILGHVPSQSVDRTIRHARSTGITRFAALLPEGVYGQRASSAMLTAVRASGGTVVATESYDRTNLSIKSAVQRLVAKGGYDAVLIADGGRVAVQAADMLRAAGDKSSRILGTELWTTEAAVTSTASLNGAWYAAVSDERYRQFATNYRTRFGSNPFRLSTLGYDSVLLTIRVARDWTPGQPFPVEKLYDNGGYLGLDGVFRFGRNGIAERALEVRQVGGGQTSTVSAAPGSFGN